MGSTSFPFEELGPEMREARPCSEAQTQGPGRGRSGKASGDSLGPPLPRPASALGSVPPWDSEGCPVEWAPCC